jgi:hypothetical protein
VLTFYKINKDLHGLTLLGYEVPDHDIAIKASRYEFALLLTDADGADSRFVQIEHE